MDSKIIFSKTVKGEEEAHGKTPLLFGDIKRALLMVDGAAAFGEISKRSAPSLRSVLDEMFEELEKGGFIQDKAKIANIPRIVVPAKMAVPPEKPAVNSASELDFTAVSRAPSSEMLAAEAARTEAEEVAELKAQQEAEAARRKAEQEAKAREEAERRAMEEAKAARIKAEQEAARIKAEAEAKAQAEAEAKAKAKEEAKLARQKAAAEAKAREEAELARQKAAAEAKAREEAERRAMEEAKAARIKAEQEAEAAQIKAEQEANAREEAELHAKEKEEAERRDTEAMLLKSAQDAAQASVPVGAGKIKPGEVAAARSTSATVLFFDVVGYTRQSVNKQIQVKKQFNQLLSDCLTVQGDGDRIILDTGDGAAIGFLQHPEDALEVAMQFRKTVMANEHKDFPDLKVRIGIHLGPINIIRDVNGQNNMVGDGINDAQRVMSFAGTDQIYISRSYYDFVSRLSDEYADLFQYRGAQQDKHGREHPVYELVDALATVAEVTLPQAGEATPVINLEPFSFVMPEENAPHEPAAHDEPESQQEDAALVDDIEQFKLPEKAEEPVEVAQAIQQQPPSAVPSPLVSVPETPPPEAAARPVAKAYMPSEEEVRKLAEAQAKTWAGAEQRAAEAARASAERAAQPHEVPHPVKDMQAARASRKPIPWGKVGAGLFVVLLAALFAAPYLLPLQGYAARIEQLLAARLQQPVHIGQLAGRLLPMPHLKLSNISIGEAKQIQVQQAQVNFELSALFSSNKPISAVELDGVQITNADLTQISAWLPRIAADPQYPIALIKLSRGRLEAEGVQLSGIGGEIGFTQAGKFAQAKLYAEEGKFALDINAAPENKMQASIAVRGSALPLLPNWFFDDLSAKGELTGDSLVITDLDSRIMGGVLLGDARIDWRSGWRVQGSLTARAITLQNMSKVLSGDMEGTARFQMQSASLSGLVETATLEGVFKIRKGVIAGVDIIETARLRSRESLPGGRTHFDELGGDWYYANGDYHFRQVRMNAGVLNATGTLDIAKQQVSGRVIADLTMRAEMGSVALQVDGTTDSLALRAAP